MNQPKPATIRKFEPEDADACFRIRTEAFIRLFYDEIGPDGVVAGVNACMPAQYVKMAGEMPIFVAVANQTRIGFVALRFDKKSSSEMEIPYLFVKTDWIGRGIGTELAMYAENWIRKHHPQIEHIWLETVVPKYNQKFYEKIGYVVSGQNECQYPDGTVKAVQLIKKL